MRPIHAETLVGHALNLLIRGNDAHTAYERLRRDYRFSHYSSQQLSGAIRTAARLNTEAAALNEAPGDVSLRQLYPRRYRRADLIGYRVLFHFRIAGGVWRTASTTINLPATTSRAAIVAAAEAYILEHWRGQSDIPQNRVSLGAGTIYSILPGGYQAHL